MNAMGPVPINNSIVVAPANMKPETRVSPPTR